MMIKRQALRAKEQKEKQLESPVATEFSLYPWIPGMPSLLLGKRKTLWRPLLFGFFYTAKSSPTGSPIPSVCYANAVSRQCSKSLHPHCQLPR
jgi:hypothetical protein